jgi:hypothetical protein
LNVGRLTEKRGKSVGIVFNVEHCATETVDIETAALSMVNGNGVGALTRLRTFIGEKGSAAV